MQIAPIHAALIERLQQFVWDATYGNGSVLDGKLQDGEEMPMLEDTSGVNTPTVAPHVCLIIGPDWPHPRGRSVAGVRDALGILTFAVSCYASDNFKVTQLRDVVWDALVGWKPTYDSGEIEGDGGGEVEPPVPGVLKPQVYMRELGFWTTIGAAGAP